MRYIYVDPETGWEYSYDFASEHAPSRGFLLQVRIPTNSIIRPGTIDMVCIHTEPMTIVEGKPNWMPYHTRKQDPLTSASARAYAEKLVNLRVFM